MDGFGDNFDQPEVDPAAEFLAREQNELAGMGIDDELPLGGPAAPVITNGSAGLDKNLDIGGSFEMIDSLGESQSVPASSPFETFGQSQPDQDPFGQSEGQDPFGESDSQDPFGQAFDQPQSESQSKPLPAQDPFAVPDVQPSVELDDVLSGNSTQDEGQTLVTSEPIQDYSDSIRDSGKGDAPSENQVGNEEPAEEETSSPAPHRPTPVREEPEKIKKWREEQKSRLEEKDANEEKKKDEMREAAKKELEEWYRHHDDLISKTRAANRNAEKQFVADDDEIEPGTEWERIAKLCDFNPKANKGNKDVSRMRSIILQLKQNPLPMNGFGNKRS